MAGDGWEGVLNGQVGWFPFNFCSEAKPKTRRPVL